MFPGRCLSLCWTLLSVCLMVSSSPGQTNIRVGRGQTVSLPCKALNNGPVTVVDWIRTEPKPEEELLSYRDERFDPDYQDSSLKKRVDLQDKQMKDGDVSLILNNVTTNDSGTYECHVQTKTNRRKRDTDPISTIRLDVLPSGQGFIRAEPGQTVSLPCKALNNEPVSAVAWSRTDPKPEEDLVLYRDGQFDPAYQHPSYKNRVDLQDRQMKDGNVSLILKDVTTDDGGTYTCYVQTKTNRRKRAAPEKSIFIIRLDVASSGHKDERGDKDGRDKEGLSRGHFGRIAGVGVVVSLVVAVSLIIVRHVKKKSSPPSSPSVAPSLESSDHLLV